MDVMNTYNYIVPASGTTRGVVIRETLSTTPITRDFREFQQDGIPFIPSGVYVDNTLGTADCVIVINNIGFRIVVPAGSSLTYQYPAPSNQSVNIVGEGPATIVFVDYPVIPYAPGGGGGGSDYMPRLEEIVFSQSTISNILDGLAPHIVHIANSVPDRADSLGFPLPASFDYLPQTLEYDGDDKLTSITVSDGTNTYVQTYGYTDTNLTSISGWVKQ